MRVCSLTRTVKAAIFAVPPEPEQRKRAAPDTRIMETVGGYRLVRKLGAGERAEIHLGHAGSREPPDGDRIAAIKVYRPATDDASIDREIEALARASSRHLLELRDLATGPDGRPCLILPRLGSGTLGRLLAVRGTVEAGEAVSVLVPLFEAVRELHRVGVAHGAVTPASVLFDDRGAPILARFGAVSLIGDFPVIDGGQSLTPAQLDEQPQAIDDRAGLRDLLGTVLVRLGGGASSEPLAALRFCVGGDPPTELELTRLIDLLFDLAPALPVRFDDDEIHEAPPLSPSVRWDPKPMSPREVPGLDREPLEEAPRTTGLMSLLLPSSARSLATESRDEHPLVTLRSRMVSVLKPVRTPVWIAGGAGLGALVIALTIIPSAHSEPAGRPLTTAGASATAGPSATGPAGAPGGPAGLGVSPSATPAAEAVSAIEGDDPLAAARSLLATRTRCFTTHSMSCLDTVDQAGSAVIESDRDLLRGLKKGVPLPAEATLEGFMPRLIQQLGDSAIIQLVAADGGVVTDKNPAPLLLVRNEAGWRIRDLSLG